MPTVGTEAMEIKKKVPKKFYILACLLGGIAVTGILFGIRGQHTDLKTAGAVSDASFQAGSERTELPGQEKESKEKEKEDPSTPDAGEKIQGIKSGETITGTGPGASLDFDDYYWGKRRYTHISVGYLTDDMQWRDFMEIKNNDSMKETMGYDYGGTAILLESYLEQHNLKADTATVLLDRYQGTSYGREEYYIQFNDEAGTLVTFIYYKAEGTHGAYLDVLPCQYTQEELEGLK